MLSFFPLRRLASLSRIECSSLPFSVATDCGFGSLEELRRKSGILELAPSSQALLRAHLHCGYRCTKPAIKLPRRKKAVVSGMVIVLSMCHSSPYLFPQCVT